jgi:4-aminobutyrate aminotransferase / (S)-3-amino-2-methylpropionate transaminase / 5-aminovalerate transaminase
VNKKATNEDLSRLRKEVLSRAYASSTSVYVESARGAMIRDVEGREYIDFGVGIGVMNVGHSHPKVVQAIKDQAEKFTHTAFTVSPYETAVRLAQHLCKATPGSFPKAVFFTNSGAEAVENAVKVARYYTKKPGIIALENAFHGRTYLAMTLTSRVKPYKLGFGPLASNIYYVPSAYCYRCHAGLSYPGCGVACADYLKECLVTHAAPEDTAALIVEAIQGEGGFITPPPEYFSKLIKVCRDNGILFIADEIQSGMGRTGKMFAMEHYGVEPDVVTVAKSFAAGMPLSAVVGKKEIMDSVHPGGLGGTYGGNPIACSAALAVFEIFEEEDLLGKSVRLGKRMRERLETWPQKYELVGDVRGLGPMLAVELVRDRHTKEPAAEEAKAVAALCVEKGLIVLVCGIYGNVLRFMPPLVITDEQLDRGLSILEESLASIRK